MSVCGNRSPIIVALDVPDLRTAQKLVDELHPLVGFFKIGLELFTAEGLNAIETVKAAGGRVFLDLKYHDIPNTVKRAVMAACSLGVDMLTIHASGGANMLMAAAEAASLAPHPPILLGVTVLTSIDAEALYSELKVRVKLEEHVVHLGKMAMKSGLQGIVASPLETDRLRHALGNEAIIICPGVRPAWAQRDDQKRVATPEKALSLGADYVVIGRPITKAHDPRGVTTKILQGISKYRKEVKDR
ncbi:MAG: orotidine-5'-phosphate decarboxylase [Firmicutes bacterium]|nr:orotidine-5'-phosphate decarboxylase [Bacillota bacterium]